MYLKKENPRTDIPRMNISQMNDLYQDLFMGGKALRASVACQTAGALGLSKSATARLGRIVEYIHQSSLLHDDVIDASPVRRGSASTWVRYSMKRAVLAGDYLLAQAGAEVASLNSTALMKLTAETLKNLVTGEWMQADLKGCENPQELKKVHELKTASLFQWALRAPFLVAGRFQEDLHKSLNRIGLMLGVLFQRADDLLDFDVRNSENKPVFKDMREGYFNSFAVHLSVGKPADFKSALKACCSLQEVRMLTGAEGFNKALSDFDKINQDIIADCHKEIDFLGTKLPPSEQSLMAYLKKQVVRFYWRRDV